MLDALRARLSPARAIDVPVNDLLEQIDTTRTQIAELQATRAAVEAAPRPPEAILSDLDDRLSALAADALDALNLPALLHPGATADLRLSATGAAQVEAKTLLGLMVLTSRAGLRKLLTAQVEQAASASPTPPMTEGDRQMRIAELDSAILQASLAEERAIRRLEGVGIAVQRRADMSPLAALADDAALPSG